MGHDTHFLSRLQRVEGRALDLALGLYRDTPLLHWTLKRLPLADSDEVVALPLNNAPEPPYALVSRKGKFITCLASGMRPAETCIAWDALTAATREMEAWRALRAEGQERTNLVMRRMHTAGPWLPREDFEDLLVISAMAPDQFLEDLLQCSQEVLEFRKKYRHQVYRTLNSQTMGQLSWIWKLMWATAHATLVHVESAVRLEAIRPGRSTGAQLLGRTRLQTFHHLDGMYVRAGWCIGRLGGLVKDEALAIVRDTLAAEQAGKSGPTSAMVMLYGLVAMTVRSPELALEVRTQLEEMLPPPIREIAVRPGVLPRLVDLLEREGPRLPGLVATAVALLHEVPEFKSARNEILFVLKDFMQGPLEDRVQVGPDRRIPQPPAPEPTELPPDAALPSPDEFPEDLIYVVPFNTVGTTMADATLMTARMVVMPLLARREAVDQFFTRARLVSLASIFKLHTAPAFVRAHLEAYLPAPPAPVVRPPTPGRNEPCSCGSGQKYKKCCGA